MHEQEAAAFALKSVIEMIEQELAKRDSWWLRSFPDSDRRQVESELRVVRAKLLVMYGRECRRRPGQDDSVLNN